MPNPALHVGQRWPTLGDIMIMPEALSCLHREDIDSALDRHEHGDWGDVEHGEKLHNDRARRDGRPVLSSYRSAGGITFWVETQGDRPLTTVSLPHD